MVAVRYLTGPRLFAIGVLLAAAELAGGNISLLLAAAIVVGFRWPGCLGADPVDQGLAGDRPALVRRPRRVAEPGHRARRDGRGHRGLGGDHARARGSSGSTSCRPSPGRDPTWAAVPIPLMVRLPVAVAVVVWGARTDRRWTVPVACMLALPALWYGGLTMLLAVIVLRQPDLGRPVNEPARWTRPLSAVV